MDLGSFSKVYKQIWYLFLRRYQHVAFLPFVGYHLVRLELLDCVFFDGDVEEPLTDSLLAVSQYCSNLESFAITESDITTSGIEQALNNTNPDIVTTLNLSGSHQLDSRAVSIISNYLPRLRKIRIYWNSEDWLTDMTL